MQNKSLQPDLPDGRATPNYVLPWIQWTNHYDIYDHIQVESNFHSSNHTQNVII